MTAQLQANLGWCFAANNAIVEPSAAVELKLYRKGKSGKREEIVEHELLDLLDNPTTPIPANSYAACTSAT
jgi:hypothetical protein